MKLKWEVIEHNWSDTSIVDCDTGKTICTLSIYDEATEEDQEELEIYTSKQALLISKAPEMLEMLKEVLAGRIRPREYQSEWDMVNELIKEATELK